jgi:hypothetical protein
LYFIIRAVWPLDPTAVLTHSYVVHNSKCASSI